MNADAGHLDPVLLSRIQFALTIMFHYLFPPLSIGLGVLLVFMEGMFLRTGNPLYESMTKFWTRIFAVTFAMGVASGIVMEFQFGTNWSNYSRFVGDVFGSALAAEGIFAFFLESGFLAVLVFGWHRVSPRMHFFSTCMVALGSMFSAIWIVVANSWQQTPAGFHLARDGNGWRAEIDDFCAMVFNPSSGIRLAHTMTGAFILGALFVMSVTAYYILRRRHVEFARKGFMIALIWCTTVSTFQLLLGDIHARQVARTQPAKLAAFEGLFRTTKAATGLSVFGWPDEKAGRMKYAVEIPAMLSLLVHHDSKKPVQGLDTIPQRDRPPVLIPFLSYHIMIGIGVLIIAVCWLALILRWRGTLFEHRWLLWVFVFLVVGGFIANEVGWIGAEVGRQPWTVYKLLRTSDSVSPSVKGGEVLASILMFGFVYSLLFCVWVYVLNDKIHHGPEETGVQPVGHDVEGFLESGAVREGYAGSMSEAKEESWT